MHNDPGDPEGQNEDPHGLGPGTDGDPVGKRSVQRAGVPDDQKQRHPDESWASGAF